MPAQRNTYQSIASSGSFVMRVSLHNRDCFSSARDDLSRPHPAYEDVYFCSNTSNPGSDEFQDLGLNDFLVELRNELRELREAHGRLSRQVGELNTLAEDMRRHLRLPQTPEERAAARIKANLRAAEDH